MKKTLFILIGLCLIPLCVAATFFGGNVVDSDIGGTACVGYDADRTDCVEGTIETDLSITYDNTLCRTWTATESGTAKNVHIGFGNCGTDPGTTVITVAFYVDTELRGTATITPANNSWVTSGDFSAYSGRSLTFSSGDVLKYGISVDYGDTGIVLSRLMGSSNPNFYSEDEYLADPFSDTTSASYELLYIFEYTK